MMLLPLAVQASAIDAERAFAAAARSEGQWTASRRYATADATMFDPQPVNAQPFLKEHTDPPRSVEWRPARSFVSCDGRVAANTGPWRNAGGATGYFSTIWVKQPGGEWEWTVDGGEAVTTPRFSWNDEPVERRASCSTPAEDRGIDRGRGKNGRGQSPDKTLRWSWTVAPDGARIFAVRLWTGARYEEVITDTIAAAPRAAAKP